MTYYEILEVSENASQEVIHMAYKALAKKYHPDVCKDDPIFAERQMMRINGAYQVLSDPRQRRIYDDVLRRERDEARERENSQAKHRKPKKEKVPPTLKRSTITVGILLCLAFALHVFGYFLLSSYKDYSVAHIVFLASFDFIFLSLGHMFFPLLIGSIKKECSLTFIETMSWINSVAVVIFLNILTDYQSGGGWVLIIVYWFINRHVLYQMHQIIKQRKHRVIAALSALVILSITLFSALCGLFLIQNNTADIAGAPKDATIYYIGDVFIDTEKTSTYYVDEYGNEREINYSAYYMDEHGNLIRIEDTSLGERHQFVDGDGNVHYFYVNDEK